MVSMTANINPASLLRFHDSDMTLAAPAPDSYEKQVITVRMPCPPTLPAQSTKSKLATPLGCEDCRNITRREIKTCNILKRAPHPHVCGYRGVVVTDDLVTGLMFDRYDMTLREFLYSEWSDDMSISKCIQEIKDGIEHIHSLGLVHCDIKPDNIFVHLASARFVVGDFDSVHREGQRLHLKRGTDGWAPPEEDTDDFARREIDFYSLQMIQAWLEKKISYRNTAQNDDDDDDDDDEAHETTNILDEAREHLRCEENTQYAQNMTGQEKLGVDKMDTSW